MNHLIRYAILDPIFGERNFRNEIKWCYEESGLASVRHTAFPSKTDTIFWYSKSSSYCYIPQLREYKPEYRKLYKTDATGTYREKWRYHKDGSGYKVKQYLGAGVPISDTWYLPSLNGPDSERVGYSTQKPEALLERIIKASTEES